MDADQERLPESPEMPTSPKLEDQNPLTTEGTEVIQRAILAWFHLRNGDGSCAVDDAITGNSLFCPLALIR
jgi:hypothetical protein